MGRQNLIRHYLRLNLQNEQHQRIQKVLESLNKDVHKSENQFIIKAIDFYIQSFDDDMADKMQKKKAKYVTVEELDDIRKELEDSMKEELIRLLGKAIIGGTASSLQWNREGSMQEESREDETSYAAEAANRWG